MFVAVVYRDEVVTPAVEAVEAVEAVQAVEAVEGRDAIPEIKDEETGEVTQEAVAAVKAVAAVEAVAGVTGVEAVDEVREKRVVKVYPEQSADTVATNLKKGADVDYYNIVATVGSAKLEKVTLGTAKPAPAREQVELMAGSESLGTHEI